MIRGDLCKLHNPGITARLPEVLVHEHMVNAIVISATGESPRGMVPMVPVIMRLFILQKWIMSFLLLWFISPDPWALIIPTQLRFGSPPIAFMSLHAYNTHVMLFKAIQMDTLLLDVPCCVHLHTLLNVVGSSRICLHTIATLMQQHATLLAQQSWE